MDEQWAYAMCSSVQLFLCSDCSCLVVCSTGLFYMSMSNCACMCVCTPYVFSFQKTLSGDDLKEMGITMGPRKKLLTFLREHNQAEEVRDLYCLIQVEIYYDLEFRKCLSCYWFHVIFSYAGQEAVSSLLTGICESVFGGYLLVSVRVCLVVKTSQCYLVPVSEIGRYVQ